MSVLAKILLVIAIISAVTWGLIAFFNFNLVDAISGGGSAEQTSAISRVVYAIAGLCACTGAETSGIIGQRRSYAAADLPVVLWG